MNLKNKKPPFLVYIDNSLILIEDKQGNNYLAKAEISTSPPEPDKEGFNGFVYRSRKPTRFYLFSARVLEDGMELDEIPKSKIRNAIKNILGGPVHVN